MECLESMNSFHARKQGRVSLNKCVCTVHNIYILYLLIIGRCFLSPLCTMCRIHRTNLWNHRYYIIKQLNFELTHFPFSVFLYYVCCTLVVYLREEIAFFSFFIPFKHRMENGK